MTALWCRLMWPSRGGKCPQCGLPFHVPDAPRERPWELRVECPSCQWAGSALSLIKPKKETGPPELPPLPEPPAGSTIVHTTGETEMWQVPRTGKSGCILGFGILWLVMSLPTAAGVWFMPPEDDMGELLWVFRGVFGIGFPLLGAIFIWTGLGLRYARHVLVLDREFLSLERELFGRRKRKKLRRSGIQSVTAKVFYSRNYQPVYGIEIRGMDGKLRFGSALADMDKAWLVNDLRRALQLPESGGLPAKAPEPAQDGTPSYSTAVEIDRSRGAVDIRLAPPARVSVARTGLVMMLIATLVIAGATGMVLVQMTGDSTDWITVCFGSLFVIVPAGFLLAGWMLRRLGRRLARTATILHTDASRISVEWHYRGKTTGDELRTPEVQRIQISQCGEAMGKPVLHGELVTADRVVWFGTGSAPEDLAAICAALREATGRAANVP